MTSLGSNQAGELDSEISNDDNPFQTDSGLPSGLLITNNQGYIHHGDCYNHCITNISNYNPTEPGMPTSIKHFQRTDVSADVKHCDLVNQSIKGNVHPGIKYFGNNNQNVVNNYYCHSKNNVTKRRRHPDATIELKRKLKESYKNARLPRVPWLGKGTEMPLKDYYTELQLDSTEEIIQFEDIFEEKTSSEVVIDGCTFFKPHTWYPRRFHKSEDNTPKRILIEGQPGFGKTTLTCKLAFDWAIGCKYMKKFKLMFVLHLKEILNDTVTNGLATEAQKCNFIEPEELQDVICRNGSRVLIVLDGFDELPPGCTRDSVLKVLYKIEYSDATVAVTCRNGMFEVGNEELNTFCSSVSKRVFFWDRKISVIGVDQNGMRILLTKFLSENRANEMIAKLENLNEPFREILKCPLILLLLGFLYANKVIVEMETSKTKLYKAILNGLGKYNMARLKVKVDEDFDLFGRNLETTFINKDDLAQFGNLCLHSLLESKFKFEDSHLIQKVYKIGFLTKTETRSPFSTTYHFEAMHRSIIEYFAAFFIWQEFVIGENQLNQKTIRILNNIYFETKGTSLVLPFLVGMIESADVHHFFNQLSPNAQLYSRIHGGLWRILDECRNTDDKTIESLIPFIPPRIHSFGEKSTSDFASLLYFFEPVLKDKFRQVKVQVLTLRTNLDEIYICSSDDVHFERVEFILTPSSLKFGMHKKYSSFCNQISCSSVKFVFAGRFENSQINQTEMTGWLKNFENLKAEKKLFLIAQAKTCDLILWCLENGSFNRELISFISCNLQNNDCAWMELFVFLLKRNQLQGLQLRLRDKLCWSKMNEIFKFASKSELISSLILYGLSDSKNINSVIDLQSLTDNGLKRWGELRLDGMKVISSIQEDTREFKVNEFYISKVDSSVANTLLNSNVLELQCFSTFLSRLQNISKSFTDVIFRSLTELILHLDNCLGQSKFWTKLNNFRKIEKFAIYFINEKPFSDNLIPAIQLMKMKHFEIWCRKSSFNRSRLFIRQLVKSLPLSHLKKINVCVWNKVGDLSELVRDLLGCLDDQILEEVGIIWMRKEDCSAESLNWVDEEKFKIENCILGVNEDEMSSWRRRYSCGYIHQKVIIQLRMR